MAPARFLIHLLGVLASFSLTGLAQDRASIRPNILWITSEDNGPELGCYGDAYATTPHIDGLAKRGLRYLNAWSSAPVCAPARTTIISGLFPPSTGAENMRSMARLPEGFRLYPQYLREMGYYCTNNSKKDYNLVEPGQVWDESSKTAHWKNRADGQPFFAIFNHTVSHESQVRKRPHQAVHDPNKVRVPPYHPDTPEVRCDWAQYYDKISEMDAKVGENLRQLEEAGLAEDTIVFYYGDHGAGMPRSKRWPYRSGLRVPLVVHVPEKFQHLAPPEYRANGEADRLVSFLDLAPTVLSLIGVKPPEHMHGKSFMGPYDAGPQPYIYGFRARMDERYDLIRAVRDDRYLYIRHYMPHRIYGQHIAYMFEMPTTQVWLQRFTDGQLNEVQSRFWQPKPTEELFDLETDPDNIRNLASTESHRGVLNRLRRAQQDWAVHVRDVGFLPEGEIHSRAEGSTPYEMGHDPDKYPMMRIMGAADLAARRDLADVPTLIGLARDTDSAVRYWAALGFLIRGAEAVRAGRDTLLGLLDDSQPYPRLAAANALSQWGQADDLESAMKVLMASANCQQVPLFESFFALNAIDDLGERAKPWRDVIAALPKRPTEEYDGRLLGYAPSLLKHILGQTE